MTALITIEISDTTRPDATAPLIVGDCTALTVITQLPHCAPSDVYTNDPDRASLLVSGLEQQAERPPVLAALGAVSAKPGTWPAPFSCRPRCPSCSG